MRNVRHRGRVRGREAAEQQQSVSKPNCVVVTFFVSCFHIAIAVVVVIVA